jgi:hypothetical protein
MHLDPLTAAHARRLANLAAEGRPVVVLLSDPPDPIVPLAARAELAAALEPVSAVLLLLLNGSAPIPAFIDERPADLERRQALLGRVFTRHAVTAG